MASLINNFCVGNEYYGAFMDYQTDILEIRDHEYNLLATVDSWGRATSNVEKYNLFNGHFKTDKNNMIILKNENGELIFTSKEKYFYLGEIDAFKYIAEKANEIQKETNN